MGGKLVAITTVVHEVVIENVNGQAQFRLWVAAPPNRIEEELIPLLSRVLLAEGQGWTARETGQRRDLDD